MTQQVAQTIPSLSEAKEGQLIGRSCQTCQKGKVAVKSKQGRRGYFCTEDGCERENHYVDF